MWRVEYNKVHREMRDERSETGWNRQKVNHGTIHHSMYAVLRLWCVRWQSYSAYTILSIGCTRCMLYSVCAVLGVSSTWCMLYSMYGVLGVWCTWGLVYLGSGVLGVGCTGWMRYRVYEGLGVWGTGCMGYWVYGVLGVCGTGCMRYRVYAVLGVCGTWCKRHLVNAVLGRCGTQGVLHSVYAILAVDSESLHGEIERDNVTSCTLVMVQEEQNDRSWGKSWWENGSYENFVCKSIYHSLNNRYHYHSGLYKQLQKVFKIPPGELYPWLLISACVVHIVAILICHVSFFSTSLSLSWNTKFRHPSSSLHAMIESSHWVQHTPKIVHRPFIVTITSWPLNAASASSMPPHMIDRHQRALQESSKVKSPHHTTKVVTKLTHE